LEASNVIAQHVYRHDGVFSTSVKGAQLQCDLLHFLFYHLSRPSLSRIAMSLSKIKHIVLVGVPTTPPLRDTFPTDHQLSRSSQAKAASANHP
jgi:hypothetical protein